MRELEALRSDISNAAKKVVPVANGAPKPSIVPPLEDDRPHPQPAPSAPLENGFQRQIQTQPPHTAGISQNSFIPHHVPAQPNAFSTQSPLPLSQTPSGRQDPFSTASSRSFTPTQALPSPTSSHTFARQQLLPQSPGAGPSSPVVPINPGIPARQAVDEPPLGGRFVDGTKSMFVPKSTSSPRPSPLSFSSSVSNIAVPSSTAPFDPLRSDSYPSISSPLQNAGLRGPSQQPSRPQQIDPLGLGTPHTMTGSLRIQPTRPRLDAREAASKLANMF